MQASGLRALWDSLEDAEEDASLLRTTGVSRQSPRPRPKLDLYLDHIRQILDSDKQEPVKPRHTARRIYLLRLKDEHGYTGGESTLREAVRQLKAQGQKSSYR
ncbi:MAG: hypothetical protein QM703_13545 [Gemmatales bacterium]